jgi:hypothetical protein
MVRQWILLDHQYFWIIMDLAQEIATLLFDSCWWRHDEQINNYFLHDVSINKKEPFCFAII